MSHYSHIFDNFQYIRYKFHFKQNIHLHKLYINFNSSILSNYLYKYFQNKAPKTHLKNIQDDITHNVFNFYIFSIPIHKLYLSKCHFIHIFHRNIQYMLQHFNSLNNQELLNYIVNIYLQSGTRYDLNTQLLYLSMLSNSFDQNCKCIEGYMEYRRNIINRDLTCILYRLSYLRYIICSCLSLQAGL